MRFGTAGIVADTVSGVAGLASAILADMIRFRVPDNLFLPPSFRKTECPNINYERKRGQCWVDVRRALACRR